MMHLDEYTAGETYAFASVNYETRAYEFDDLAHITISYEMDLNLHVASRTVYTFLDWLGDVGGLMGIVVEFGGLIMMFILGNGLNYMLI